MARERSADFLLNWLHTIESLGFIICFIIFSLSLYHIYFEPNETKSTNVRGHNHKIDSKVKWLSLLSVLLYALSCLTNISFREAEENHWFILTQFCYAFATILSYLLFMRQLYIIYNERSTVYEISRQIYIILSILIGIFAVFMFSKSILIVFLDEGYLTSTEYGEGGAITVYASSITDLIITIFMLYLFNSRLTATIKGFASDSGSQNVMQQNLLNVRLKHTILTAFAVITTQLYLIIWSVTVLIWYNYKGDRKDIYVYDFHIATLTIRAIACVTNSLVLLLNFKFGNKYYHCCCHPILWCCWKASTYSEHQLPAVPKLLLINTKSTANVVATPSEIKEQEMTTGI